MSTTRGVQVNAALAEIIRMELGRQELSQAQLAKMTGISGATLTRKLHQGKAISVTEADAILDALGLDFLDTFARANEMANGAA